MTKKTKLARKMRTHEELVSGVSIFNTDAWNKRVAGRQLHIMNKIKKIKEAIAKKKAKLNAGK